MTRALEHQSELTERRALESLHGCCPAGLKSRLGLEWLDVDGVAVSACAADPSILLNRAIGLGHVDADPAQTIAAVAGLYAERSIEDYFLHAYDAVLDEAAVGQLAAAGLHRRRGWMKFVNPAPAPRGVRSALTVERVDRDSAQAFASIVCRAFDLRDASIPLVAALVEDPRWHLFLSRDGDQPAGTGGLFIDGDFGWLDWAATDPAFRCRGSQSAIMSARLALAAERGCTHVFTETGEAVEGDPQHSYSNILRAGFRELVSRANYSPTPAS